jgi:hypothetical protein
MKKYFESSKQQKYKKRQKLKEYLKNPTRFLYRNGLRIRNITIEPRSTQNENSENIEIEINKKETHFVSKYKQKMLAVKAKDTANLSYRKYEILRENFSWLKIPSWRSIQPVQKLLNEQFTIHQNKYGFYVEPFQKIKFVCKKFIESEKTRPERLKLKLCTDGTSLTKSNVGHLNFSFTLLNDSQSAKSVFGNYILGKFNIAF